MLSDPMWEPLCAAIIFGLIASTIFSLLIIPPLYLLLTSKSAEIEDAPLETPYCGRGVVTGCPFLNVKETGL